MRRGINSKGAPMVPDDLRGNKVLVVDDSPGNLLFLAGVLKKEGLEPSAVSSGSLALKSALKEPPDIILLGMNMAEMSGLEVCQRFKREKRLQRVPILFISGDPHTEAKAGAFRAGAVDYISKPFHPEEVLARVTMHLRMGRLQAQTESRTRDLERRVAEQ